MIIRACNMKQYARLNSGAYIFIEEFIEDDDFPVRAWIVPYREERILRSWSETGEALVGNDNIYELEEVGFIPR